MKKNVWIHVGMVLAMLAVSLVYFTPVLEGKALYQGDTVKFEAMVKETKDYHAATGEYAHWNSALFSGMPVYQVGGNAPMQSIVTPIRQVVNLDFLGVGETIGVVFLYLIGFYLALILLGCSPWIALLGALAFGLGSYNIIIVEAGHISKAWALAMTAPILSGMVLCLRKAKEGQKKWGDWLWGGLLFTLALTLQLNFNHIQITYYTIIAAVLLGLVYLIYSLKDKYFKQLTYGTGILLVGCALAFACNTATTEIYTLLVPGAMGGGSGEPVSKESASYQAFHQESMPLYWGNQPFTSGPVYFGAIVIMLFIMGCILVKGPERWWLIAAALVAIVMSWGRNFMGLNEWLFNHLPMYNKFRTPSMSLVIANVAMVMLGALGLKEMFNKEIPAARKRLALYIAGGLTAGILLIGLLVSGSLSYSGASDTQMAAQYGNQWQQIQDIFIQDRKALFVSDTWRSMIFVVLAFAALWFYVYRSGKSQENKQKGLMAGITLALIVLVMVDLWGVDRRYLNEKNYVNAEQLALHPDPWDYEIDRIAAQTGDEDYRVLNLATNTFNDSKPAAFHHQIGGYSAVKMRRYQDIIDFYIARHINMDVLNMLNARYFVVQGGQVQRNPDALGNTWFVSRVKWVDDANGEILALNDFNPSEEAVVNKNEWTLGNGQWTVDSAATIVMEHQKPYNPDYLKYRTHSRTEQLAVFSEVYYEPDWRAYIDGKPAEYIRANYILRAMVIPAGDHVVEFRNEAPLFHKMNIVTIVGSILLVLIAAGGMVLYYRKREEE